MRFLWQHVAAPEPAFRHKCTELFYRFAPLVVADLKSLDSRCGSTGGSSKSSTGAGSSSGPVSSRAQSCRAWLEQESQSNNDQEDNKSAANTAVSSGGVTSLRALIGSTFECALVACPMAHSSGRDWLRAMVAALDAYAWALNKGVVSVPELFGGATSSDGGSAKGSGASSKKRKGSLNEAEGTSSTSSNSSSGGGVHILEAIALFAEHTLKDLHSSVQSTNIAPPPPPTSNSGVSGATAGAGTPSSSPSANHRLSGMFAEEIAELAELRAKVKRAGHKDTRS